jgi:DNA-binding LacI/PurR family transcriptional regulator
VLRQEQQPPVLRDVAERAGVSLSTVSRVLTGRTPVSPSLRTRVETAVAELGYRPNAAAQTLVSGRRSTVAVLARNTLRYGYAATLQGIEEAARSAGFVVTIGVVESDEPRAMKSAVDLVLSQPLAGAIVVEFDALGVATLEALPDSLPVVAAAGARRKVGSRPHAFLDDEAGGLEATQYLLSLGHRTVHHVAIPATRARSGRSWGWRTAMKAAGLEPPPPIQASYDPDSGYDAGRQLAEDPSVTAVLCGNDELAIGVIRALVESGRRVPEDVSVVGFDDQPFARMWTPPLTTVAQDFVGLGQRTFQLLAEWSATGRKPRSTSALPRLVVRSSAAAPRR